MNKLTNVGARAGLVTKDTPMGLRVLFDDDLYERCKSLAGVISRAEGFVSKSVIGKPEAAFAVVIQSLNWKMDPFAVARSIYQVPGGGLGYEGKLVKAILEASGLFVSGVAFEHYGDWTAVRGKFEVKKSPKGMDYPVAKWPESAEAGLGVKVSGQMVGETKPRTISLDLAACWPRNSTLWALNPEQQICYRAIRAYANTVCPHILMGARFDGDGEMIDITPSADTSAAAPVDPQPLLAADADAPALVDAGGKPEEEVTQPPRGPEITREDLEQLGREIREAGGQINALPKGLTAAQEDICRTGWAWRDGWHARAEGKSFRRPPQHITRVLVTPWRDGWQAADKDVHEGPPDDAVAHKEQPEQPSMLPDEEQESGATPEEIGQGIIDDFAGARNDGELQEIYVAHEDAMQALPREVFDRVAAAYDAAEKLHR